MVQVSRNGRPKPNPEQNPRQQRVPEPQTNIHKPCSRDSVHDVLIDDQGEVWCGKINGQLD
jgi:hypothetical protein